MSENDCDYEQQLEAILKRVDAWYDSFVQSPEFARLSVSNQENVAGITDFFARYTYEYFDLPPEEWNADAVVECCTEILPRKVSADAPFFEAIAPVLGVFFRYLDDRSHLPGAKALAEAVEELGEEIVAAAADSTCWGPAKQLVMTALDAGVDIQDPAALDAFMMGFHLQNLQQMTRATAAGGNAPFSWPARFTLEPAPPPRPAPASPYDPCPCGSGKKYKFCCKSKPV